MSFASQAIKYFYNLKPPKLKDKEVSIINSYESSEVRIAVKIFYQKYFSDDTRRKFVFGINPGRFGGGLTGICFTDPVVLKEECGIENNFGNRKELSSKFIYRVINDFGGAKKFYAVVFLSALFPFALIKDRKNFNYYDDKKLFNTLKPEIVKSIQSQIKFGARKEVVIILGKKNAEYFSLLNDEYKLFKKIIALEHPRYIMQYKLRKIDYYISKYIDALKS